MIASYRKLIFSSGSQLFSITPNAIAEKVKKNYYKQNLDTIKKLSKSFNCDSYLNDNTNADTLSMEKDICINRSILLRHMNYQKNRAKYGFSIEILEQHILHRIDGIMSRILIIQSPKFVNKRKDIAISELYTDLWTLHKIYTNRFYYKDNVIEKDMMEVLESDFSNLFIN